MPVYVTHFIPAGDRRNHTPSNFRIDRPRQEVVTGLGTFPCPGGLSGRRRTGGELPRIDRRGTRGGNRQQTPGLVEDEPRIPERFEADVLPADQTGAIDKEGA